MVCVVNGYLCFSSCDAAKARQGKDPNAPPSTLPDAFDIKKKSAFAGQPAAILDGTLKDLANATGLGGAADRAGGTVTQQPSVNILV